MITYLTKSWSHLTHSFSLSWSVQDKWDNWWRVLDHAKLLGPKCRIWRFLFHPYRSRVWRRHQFRSYHPPLWQGWYFIRWGEPVPAIIPLWSLALLCGKRGSLCNLAVIVSENDYELICESKEVRILCLDIGCEQGGVVAVEKLKWGWRTRD